MLSHRFNNSKILKDDLDQVKRAKRTWFRWAEGESIRYYKSSFDRQGFDYHPWVPRKRQRNWPILVKSGDLKNSIKVMSRGENFFVIGSDLKYAIYHNDGISPQAARPFINQSPILNRTLLDRLDSLIRIIFR